MDFVVNGTRRHVSTNSKRPLLFVLRNEFDLTGAKYGCGEGECGACTVLLDGQPVRSCQIECGSVGKRHLTTIEGLGSEQHLHPVQQSFIDCDAMQCGYCTPGMILAGVALLRKNPMPSDEQIKDALQGNICRCGTQNRILAAIHQVAKQQAQTVHKEAEA